MLRTTTLVLLCGLGLTLLAAPAARAGLIPNKVSVTTVPDAGGNYTWTYNVVVTSDVYVQPGDYFTVYDFANSGIGAAVGPVADSGRVTIRLGALSGTTLVVGEAVP